MHDKSCLIANELAVRKTMKQDNDYKKFKSCNNQELLRNIRIHIYQ